MTWTARGAPEAMLVTKGEPRCSMWSLGELVTMSWMTGGWLSGSRTGSGGKWGGNGLEPAEPAVIGPS